VVCALGSKRPPSRELSSEKSSTNETGVSTPCGGDADFSPSIEEGVVLTILAHSTFSFVKTLSSICKLKNHAELRLGIAAR
jgi:hypothetical protein